VSLTGLRLRSQHLQRSLGRQGVEGGHVDALVEQIESSLVVKQFFVFASLIEGLPVASGCWSS
jgi:hypothetical protein